MSNIYVISTGRNANKFVVNCIDSVRSQTVRPKSHIVIDDISDDDTASYLEKYKGVEGIDIKINEERKYRLKNIYDSAIDRDPEDIVCIVDSDDWLGRNTALETIKKTYEENNKLEYVYSRYLLTHGQLGCSSPIPNDNWNPYTGAWITSHMSTFKAKALKEISVNNFLDWNGEWFKIATDHAMTLPILYRLWKRDGGYSSVGFIDEPLYMHTFYGNPSKPRSGTAEADDRARLAVKCSTYIKQRGYLEGREDA
jgi:glycosyltransferase involved in cell wall biosynthesis|tara:strand:- start:11303 stop:12064 length:762 start_codon:yes stop_codon:yes gene_type:complete